MRYSLADYTLSVNIPASLESVFGKSFTIGGRDNATDSISVELDEDQWSTDAFATGAYVHNKSYARNGKVTISVSQLSDAVVKLKRIAMKLYSGDYAGVNLALDQAAIGKANDGDVFIATDCYPTKIPSQEFGESAGKQTWTFTCGQITFK